MTTKQQPQQNKPEKQLRPLSDHVDVDQFMRDKVDIREYLNVPFRITSYMPQWFDKRKFAILYIESWYDGAKYETSTYDHGQIALFDNAAQFNQFPLDVVWYMKPNDKRVYIRSATLDDISMK